MKILVTCVGVVLFLGLVGAVGFGLAPEAVSATGRRFVDASIVPCGGIVTTSGGQSMVGGSVLPAAGMSVSGTGHRIIGALTISTDWTAADESWVEYE